MSRFQNPVSFGTGSWKSGLKPAFLLKSKVAVPNVNTNGNLLPKISIDKVFFSCNALNADMGATVPDYNLAVNEAGIIAMASEAILLCDSSKIGSVTFARIAPLEKIDIIVTDSDANAQDLQGISAYDGCQIIVAPVDPSSAAAPEDKLKECLND